MASTNKTTHYELSQYTGSDKPTYLVDYNTDMSNIDTGIYNAQSKADTNETAIGTLSNLDTSVKTDLVSAINEVEGRTDYIGNLSNLTTEANTNLVSAINEVDAHADTNNQNIGTMVNLETTVKTSLVGAINEINTGKNTNATNIGTLSNLDTSDKSSLVNAINEIIDYNDYSTTETNTGKTWIDGKPIYRKVFNTTTGSSLGTSTIGTIGAFDKLTYMFGYIDFGTNGIMPIPQAVNANVFTILTIDNHTSGNIKLEIQANAYINQSAVIVVEYTKTTD